MPIPEPITERIIKSNEFWTAAKGGTEIEMGFGLLLLGYVAANVMSIGFVPKMLGYALMIWACIKLSDYEPRFKRCLYVAAPAAILSVYIDANKICKMLGATSSMFPDGAVKYVGYAESLASLGFCVLLMIAIIAIAKSTELDKLAFRAARNIVITALGEAAYFVAVCLPNGNVANGIAYAALTIRALHILLDILLIFACYRMICNEGDEDMPAKETNIPILRKMEEVLNKRDKNAFDSARSFSEKRMEKKKNKSKKQKKT